MTSASYWMYVDKIWNAIVGYMPTLFSSLLVLIFGFYFIGLLSRLVSKAMDQRDFDISLKGFIRSLINVALKIILLVTVAGMLGIHTTSFVAILGAAGLAIGLALQGSLANFAGGVLILFFKPYRVGDTIEAGGLIGEVKEIQIFNTVLQSGINRTIILPNGSVSNNTIVNISRIGTSGHHIDFFFALDADTIAIKEIVISILEEESEVIKSLPMSCHVVQAGIGFLQLKCSYCTKFGIGDGVKDAVITKAIKRFREADIHLLTDFADREPLPPTKL